MSRQITSVPDTSLPESWHGFERFLWLGVLLGSFRGIWPLPVVLMTCPVVLLTLSLRYLSVRGYVSWSARGRAEELLRKARDHTVHSLVVSCRFGIIVLSSVPVPSILPAARSHIVLNTGVFILVLTVAHIHKWLFGCGREPRV